MVTAQTNEKKTTRQNFSNMSADAFQHPSDKRQLAMLGKLPGIEWLTGQLVKHSYEKMVRINQAANGLKVGKNAFPILDGLVDDVCSILQVTRPDVFVRNDPVPSARITGCKDPVMVLTTGLLDILSEEEMRCVLAHELCHVHCGHMWHLMVCDFTRDFAERLGLIGTPLLGIRLALEEWRRRAELSCDRGALLLCGDLDMQMNVLAKLAGGANETFGAVDSSTLLEQEKDFTAATDGMSLGRFYRLMMYLEPGQSFAALRAGELNRWAESKEYADLSEGRCVPEAEMTDEETRPLWGEMFQNGKGNSPVEPILCPSDLFVDGLRTTAAGAAGIVQQGASALQDTLEGFLGSFFRNAERKESAGDDNS